MMKIDRQNCTHHGVSGGTKQAFEVRRRSRCNLSTEARAGWLDKQLLIGLTDIDWHCLTFQTQRQRLLRITRDTASVRKIIGGAERNNSQCGSVSLGKIHQAMNNLVQCA